MELDSTLVHSTHTVHYLALTDSWLANLQEETRRVLQVHFLDPTIVEHSGQISLYLLSRSGNLHSLGSDSGLLRG